MTTPEAASRYEREHLESVRCAGTAIYNPLMKDLIDLPTIYGFNNGGRADWWEACALAEDGTELAGHICSSEAYMPADLGSLEGTSPYKHEAYQAHYPHGYKMEFVPSDKIDAHEKLKSLYTKPKG